MPCRQSCDVVGARFFAFFRLTPWHPPPARAPPRGEGRLFLFAHMSQSLRTGLRTLNLDTLAGLHRPRRWLLQCAEECAEVHEIAKGLAETGGGGGGVERFHRAHPLLGDAVLQDFVQ